jgi:transformation/transcription domain-associated protein
MGLMVKLIKAENEENALICIKIMIDGFRAHKVSQQSGSIMISS